VAPASDPPLLLLELLAAPELLLPELLPAPELLLLPPELLLAGESAVPLSVGPLELLLHAKPTVAETAATAIPIPNREATFMICTRYW
jgi:hypothetical protein